MRLGEEYISEAILDLLPDIRGKEICLFFFKQGWISTLQTEYLLQYQVDPVHLTVDEEAFLLPAVHLLDDAPVLCGVHNVPHRASCHLPVIGYSRLHDGLEDCKPWGNRGERAPSHNCLFGFQSTQEGKRAQNPKLPVRWKKQKQGYCGFQQWFVTIYCHTECKLLIDNALSTCLNITNHLVGTACREENKRERK